MTWFAVPNEMGGWSVASRQAPTSELDLVDCQCGHDIRHHREGFGCAARDLVSPSARACCCVEFRSVDVVICDGCKSQEDAQLLAGLLNYKERRCKTSNTWANWIIAKYSVPWPEAKEWPGPRSASRENPSVIDPDVIRRFAEQAEAKEET